MGFFLWDVPFDIDLVGGFTGTWLDDFSRFSGNNMEVRHPNWRTRIFFGGVAKNHQPDPVAFGVCIEIRGKMAASLRTILHHFLQDLSKSLEKSRAWLGFSRSWIIHFFDVFLYFSWDHNRRRILIDPSECWATEGPRLKPQQDFSRSSRQFPGTHIVSSRTIKAVRKDVLAKCYGGDISRFSVDENDERYKQPTTGDPWWDRKGNHGEATNKLLFTFYMFFHQQKKWGCHSARQ